jgi:hypothetical protein
VFVYFDTFKRNKLKRWATRTPSYKMRWTRVLAYGLSTISGLQHLNAYRFEISISQVTMDLLLFTYIFSFLYHVQDDLYRTGLYIWVTKHKPDDKLFYTTNQMTILFYNTNQMTISFYNTQQIATLYYNTRLVTLIAICLR